MIYIYIHIIQKLIKRNWINGKFEKNNNIGCFIHMILMTVPYRIHDNNDIIAFFYMIIIMYVTVQQQKLCNHTTISQIVGSVVR